MYYKRSSNSPKVRFTYNSSSYYHQSPQRTKQLNNSQQYHTRPDSLPHFKPTPQQKPQNTSHIKIVEDSFVSKRTRKHKIFEQSPLANRQSISKSRRRSQTIFGQYKRNSRQKSHQVQSNSKQIQTETIQVRYQTDKINQNSEKVKENNSSHQEINISQLNQLIDRKVVERLSIIDSKRQGSFRHQRGNQEIIQKQQEIIYLKLEVQRLKRCQNLNKQNQSLYKKLVIKLKEHSERKKSGSPVREKSLSVSPKRLIQKQTPINSLCDLKKAEPQERQKTNTFHKQRFVKENLSPKITVKSPQELFSKNGQIQSKQSEILTNNSKPMTFNNTKEIGKQKIHSKRLKMQTFPNMNQLKQQILTNELAQQTFTQFPVQNRLIQINNQLERRMSCRSSSKHKYETGTSSSFYTAKVLNHSRLNPKYQMFYY